MANKMIADKDLIEVIYSDGIGLVQSLIFNNSSNIGELPVILQTNLQPSPILFGLSVNVPPGLVDTFDIRSIAFFVFFFSCI